MTAASDLDLAVLLLNSVDLLEEPSDRMADGPGLVAPGADPPRARGARRRAARRRPAGAAGAAGHDPAGLRGRRTPTRPARSSTSPCCDAEAVVQVGPGRARTVGRRAARPAAGRRRPAPGRARRRPARASAPATRAAARTSTAPAAAPAATAARSATTGRRPARTAGARGPARPDRDPVAGNPAGCPVRLVDVPSLRLLVPAVPLVAALVLAATLTPVTSAAADEPVLGSPGHLAPEAKGWGKAQPRHVFNGGDPSGYVAQLEWRHWGRPTATGRGVTWLLRPEGGYYAAARPDRAPRRGARHLPRRHRGLHPAGVPGRPPPRRPGRPPLAPLGGRRRHLLRFRDACRASSSTTGG